MKRKQYFWQLPPEIEARLGEHTYGRQRVIFEVDHLLLILHTPPSADDHRRDAMVFLRMPDGKLLCNGTEGGEKKLPKLLEAYQQIYDRYDDRYDNATSSEDLFRILEALSPISRAANNMARALQEAREAVRDDSFILSMRDHAYEIARQLELLVSDAKTALDYRIARHAEAQTAKADEMALAQHKLNVMAAITFPLMAVATLFGMNMASGIENQNPLLFWVVLACGIAVGAVTKGWVTNNGPRKTKRRRDR